ncbi:MAG: NAD-dependent epimerase/dehydratase family protein [Cuniculiplasma sp.]
MNILVTGSRGFIGTVVMNTLRERGFNPDGVDIGDPFDENKKYDIILHFGARTLIRNSFSKPYEYFEDGLGLTMKYLEIARKHDALFLFPSSGSTAEPSNPYSLTKKEAVEWINLYRKLYSTRVIIFRLFNIYGTSARKGAVYLFSNAALKGEKAIIYGDGTHIRDYVNVEDLAKTIIRVVDGKISPGDYEIGSGKGTSVNELLNIVEKISGKKVLTEKKPFIVEEADELVARNTIVENPMPLNEGVRKIIDELKKEIK